MFAEAWKKTYPDHAEAASPGPNTSLGIMLGLVGERKRVLDVGCATGYLAKVLASRGCDVVGIDVNAEALEKSREFCSETIAVDLDVEPLGGILEERRRFDVMLFGDVLEHLRNPLAVLESVRPYIAEGGCVVASIPNVAHASVRLALLDGRFDYQDLGILDETHIRFFTRKSVEELFLLAGFQIDQMKRTTLSLSETSDLVPDVRHKEYSEEVVAEIVRDPDHDTFQFVIRASPFSDKAHARALAKPYLEANTRLSNALGRIEALERERERLPAQESEQVARARAEVVSLEEEMKRLQERQRERIAEYERACDGYRSDRERLRLEAETLDRERETLSIRLREQSDRVAHLDEQCIAHVERRVRSEGELGRVQAENSIAARANDALTKSLEDLREQEYLVRVHSAQGYARVDELEREKRRLVERDRTRNGRIVEYEKEQGELRAVQEVLRSDIERMREENAALARASDGLTKAYTALEARFASFADRVAERAAMELRRVAGEIDVIQGGLVWRVKRMLRKR